MTTTTASLDACLDDLEARIDPAQEDANFAAWQTFVRGQVEGPYFQPPLRRPSRPGIDWPGVHINDAQEDYELMMISQLAGVSGMLDGKGSRLNVRCNYGTGIMPSLFGCRMFEMPRETRTLPTAIPFHDSDQVRRLVDRGVPDIEGGLGAKVFECGRRFQQALASRPKVGKYVCLYHPDVQGPIDVAEVVWGSEIFLAVYDEPQLLHDFLDLVTDTYIAFMRRWYEMVPPPGADWSDHWDFMHPGRLMLRNDSLMNLSPETYVEFIRPRDQRLFDEFGGGAIHFCGRGDHYIEAMCEMRGLGQVDMSQPELNDMEKIFRATVDRGINLNGRLREPVEKAVAAGRPLHGRVYLKG